MIKIDPVVRFGLSLLSWEVRRRLFRAQRAWRFAMGTANEIDAYAIMQDCYEITGSYPLETVDVESVLDQAKERWGDHPDLRDYAERAVERVYGKWNSTGDTSGAACDWAMELIIGYMADEGLELPDKWSPDYEEPGIHKPETEEVPA